MDIRVDFNVTAATGANKDKNFEQEVDDFIFGGFVDWVRRDETGCYVFIQDAWIPVVDWKEKYEFPGARNLTSLARYFYNLGQMEARKEMPKWRHVCSTSKHHIWIDDGEVLRDDENWFLEMDDLRKLPKED